MRKLNLDICDYNGNVLCGLYDNNSQISGQATGVSIREEKRTGWKELSFSVPSVCETDEGPQPNPRNQYITSDRRIRMTRDDEIDWYIISEPRINHSNFSMDVSLTAGHISQILKTKNLGLEFSDEEGNNVGTCLELLTTILNGTGWMPGNVAMFMEDDDFTKEKKRSLNVEAKSGAFKMITDLCEVFAARPTFHGGDKTVDIQPINPFSHVIAYEEGTGRMKVGKIINLEEGVIPEAAKEKDILELHYGNYLKGITRTINTENIVTKLTAYGNKDDTTLGMCNLQDAKHLEYTFVTSGIILAGKVIGVRIGDDAYYYKAAANIPSGSRLIWSSLDYLSRMYLWQEPEDANEEGIAHRSLLNRPKDTIVTWLTTPEPENVQNWFTALYDFDYYDSLGMVTDDMVQAGAEYQRNMPKYVKESYEQNLRLLDAQTRLSEVGESNNGFLKLAVTGWSRTKDNAVKLTIDQSVGGHGVIYRSDYDEARKKRFTWYVAEKLKEDGSSLDNIGSVLYVIKQRDGIPPLWRMYYLRSIDDQKDTRTDIYGKVIEKYSNFSYALNENDPSFVTLFAEYGEFTDSFDGYSADDLEFFLFCSNSMTGLLGQKQTADEGLMDALASSTKVVTDTHPVKFVETGKRKPTPTDATSTYAWCYEYDPNDDDTLGSLYFYLTEISTTDVWSPVVIGDSMPASVPSAVTFFFDTKTKNLYRSLDGAWTLMDSTEEKRIAGSFTKVIYYCRKRDMIYKGLYEKYIHTIPGGSKLVAGNYAIAAPFGLYWVFTTEGISAETIGSEDIRPTASDYIEDEEYGYATSQSYNVTADAWYDYSFSNEVRVEFYILNGQTEELSEVVYMDGQGSFQMGNFRRVKFRREKLPTEVEYLTAKTDCELWVDTKNNVVYQENNIAKVIEAQTKTFDTVSFPVANILSGIYFQEGTIGERGAEVSSEEYQRSYNVDVYTGVTFEYSLPAGSMIAVYDTNRYWKRTINVESALHGLLTTNTNEGYIKVVIPGTEEPNTTNPSGENYCYMRVQGYENKFFVNDKLYTLISARPDGDLKGINNLTSEFVRLADEMYLTILPDVLAAQNMVKQHELDLAEIFGDLYREGWWEDDSYVSGDEQKLYIDAMRNLEVVAKPETTYDIDFLDLYGSQQEDEDDLEYPDITMDYAVHLVDPELNINLWAYIDELDKCYDKPWETKLTISTEISDAGQHSFTDVMSYIADVAKVTKQNQSVYARAANFSADGTLTADKLEGIISTTANKLSGASSNWYTDEKGNIVIESQDGLNAMMLTGMGFMVATSKNRDGEWLWRSFGTGSGFTGDEITGGTIRGELISARSITAEQVVSNFGQQMDIASNAALLLYATVDGVRPAGSVKTNPPNTGDSYILIKASTGEREGGKEVSPASIEIASGGEVNIYAGSGMYIATGGTFELESRNFTIDSDGNVTMAGTVTAHDGFIAGFEIGEETHVESGVTVLDKGYIRYGTQGIDSTEKGVYIGTDGINIVNDDSVGFRATADGTIYVSGEGMIAGFAMSHTNLNVKTLGTSSFTEYTEGTEPDVVTRYKTENIKIDPGVWYRVETPIEIRIDFLTTQGVLISSTNADENTNVMTPLNAYYAVVSCDAPPTNVPVKLSRYIRYLYAGTDTDPNHDTICVDSSTNGIYFGDDGLRIGSGIKIEANGDAEFDGKVTADTGEIAGFTLSYDGNNHYMYSGTTTSMLSTNDGIYIGTDGINIGGGNFKAYSDGTVSITGSINASSGEIGGWSISSSHIGNTDNINTSTIGMSSSSGDYAFWAGTTQFYVKHTGDLHATDADIGVDTDVGLRTYDYDNARKAFWAGNNTFIVRSDGKVVLNSIESINFSGTVVNNLTYDMIDGSPSVDWSDVYGKPTIVDWESSTNNKTLYCGSIYASSGAFGSGGARTVVNAGGITIGNGACSIEYNSSAGHYCLSNIYVPKSYIIENA